MRVLPWWWVLREAWFGEAIWAIYLLEERHITLGEVLLFEAVFSAVGLVADIPTGMLADRHGRRPSLLAGSLILAAAMALFALSHELWLLLGSYALWGVSDALMTGADEAFLFDSLRALGQEEQFTRRLGRLHAYTAGVTAACTVAGAAIAQWTSLATPILLSAGFSAAAVLVALRLVEPPRIAAASYLGAGVNAWRRTLGTPSLRWVVLFGAAVTVSVSTVYLTFQPIAVGYGVPVAWLSAFAVTFHALIAAGGWGSSRLATAITLRRSFALAAGLGTFALLGGASRSPWLFPVFALPVLAWAVLRPQAADYLSRRVSEQERATVLSISYMAWRVGQIAILPVIGLLIDHAGTGVGLAMCAAALGVLAVASFVFWLRAGDTELAPPAELPAAGLPSPPPVP